MNESLRERMIRTSLAALEGVKLARDAIRAFPRPREIAIWSRRHWVHVWLVPQTAVALGLFFKGAGFLRESQILARVASIESDHATRRERGSLAFRSVDQFTNVLDWEGVASPATQSVPVLISDTRLFTLEPNTVVVFRAPFKNDYRVENRFRVLKGRVTSDRQQIFKPADHEIRDREIPKTQGRQVGKASAYLYPRMHSRIFVTRPGQAMLGFFWGTKATGFIALLDQEGNRMQYFPVTDTDHLTTPIPTDHSYAWQVINPDREVLLGPYQFQLASGGPEAWKRLLSDPNLHRGQNRGKGGIDVLLDDDRVQR